MDWLRLPGSVPGQAGRLVLGTRNVGVRYDTSAIDKLTRPPVDAGPVVPSEAVIRDPSQVVKGLGLPIEDELRLSQSVTEWMGAASPVAFMKSMMSGLRAFSARPEVRNEIYRRCRSLWKSVPHMQRERKMALRSSTIQKSDAWGMQLPEASSPEAPRHLTQAMKLVFRPHPMELIWCAAEADDEMSKGPQFSGETERDALVANLGLDIEEEMSLLGNPSSRDLEKVELDNASKEVGREDWLKSRYHRYIKRVLTGKASPKYRYYYRLPSGRIVSSEDLHQGAKFKTNHDGKEGHFEVLHHDQKKGIVHVRHDESGKEAHVRVKDLERMVRTTAERKAAGPKKEGQPQLPRAQMKDFGSGGEWDQVDGFTPTSEQAHQIPREADREYALIKQPNGFMLVSRGKPEDGQQKAKARVEGMQSSVVVKSPKGRGMIEKIPCRYVLMEADQLVASHEPRNFNVDRRYPENVQEREYHRLEEEQGKVDRVAQNVEPMILINSNPDGVNGTPIVTENNVVLGGNGRTLAMKRAYLYHQEEAQKIKDYLAAHARAFGLKPADVKNMKAPVLVRQIKAGKADTNQLRLLGRRMNESLTQGLDPRVAEVALGKNFLTHNLLDTLSDIGDDRSLHEYLLSEDSKPTVAALRTAGIIDNINAGEFIDRKTELLNEDGRRRVERVLAAHFVPDAETLDRMNPTLRESLARSAASLIAAERMAQGEAERIDRQLEKTKDPKRKEQLHQQQQEIRKWDLRDRLYRAIQIDQSIRSRESKYGTGKDALKKWLRDAELPGSGETANRDVHADPVLRHLLSIVRDHTGTTIMPRDFRGYMLRARQAMADSAPMLGDIGGTIEKTSPEDALDIEFGVTPVRAKEKQQREAAEREAVRQEKERAKQEKERAKQEKQAQPDLFAASMDGRSDLFKADKPGNKPGNKLVNRAIWLAQSLIEPATRAAAGSKKPKIDSQRIVKTVLEDIKQIVRKDPQMARELGAQPMDAKVVQGIVDGLIQFYGDSDQLQKSKQNEPPAGFVPIPGPKLGGYHKRQGAGYVYWYPGMDILSIPHQADEEAKTFHRSHRVLYRAAKDDYVEQGTSFAERRSTAKEYLNNPGYGGANLYETEIGNAHRTIDLRGLTTKQAARRLGETDPGAIGIDEWLPQTPSALDAARATGALWALVDESFPAGTTTWIWLGTSDDIDEEPELEERVQKAQLSLFGAPQPRQTTMFSANRPPAGFTAIPGSKHGGYHKKVGDHYVYWYPGIGTTSSPHHEDREQAHHVEEQRSRAEGGDRDTGPLGVAGGGAAAAGAQHEGAHAAAEGAAAEPAAAEVVHAPAPPPADLPEVLQSAPVPVPETELCPDDRPASTKKVSETAAEQFLPELLVQLPESVWRFPQPAPITDSTGKVTGHIDQMFPHQREGAERVTQAWQERDGFMLLDDAGLGKTVTALAAMVHRGGKRNLIVVPTQGKEGLKQQWSSVSNCGLWGIQAKFIEDMKEANDEGTYIVSYDELVKAVKDEAGKKQGAVDNPAVHGTLWDTIVFDEAHTMASQGKERSEAGKRLANVGGKVLYLSATPMTDIVHMHYLTKLGLGFGSSPESFASWAKESGADVEGNVVNNPRSMLPMAAISATMHVDGMALKRTAMLDGLSAKFDLTTENQLTDEQRQAFDIANQVVKTASEVMGEGLLRALYTGWAKQYWETLKVGKAIGIGQQAVAEGKQVAFFTSFKASNHEHLRAIPRIISRMAEKAEDRRPGAGAHLMHISADIQSMIDQMPPGVSVVKQLADAFGGSKDVAEIHGATSKKPAAEQAAYQEGRKRVCVATMSRGGTGISLHDTTGERPRVQINLSVPWSGREFNQVAGRSHRLGSQSDTQMFWLLGDHEVEQRNAAKVAKRLKSMGALTVGDPEITVSARDLANWDFSNLSVDDDDANATVKALEAAAGVDDAPTDKASEEAEQVRDFFSEFAAQRKAGRNVIHEVYVQRQQEKAKTRRLEARRAAEQMKQNLGWQIEHRPDMGGFLLHWMGVSMSWNKTLRKLGGQSNSNLRAYLMPEEAMVELSKKTKSDHLKINMLEVAKREQETGKRTELVQAQPEVRSQTDRAKMALKSKGIIVRELDTANGGVTYLLTGNTYQHKETIKRIVGGGSFTRVPEPGWKCSPDLLSKVVTKVHGNDSWQKGLRLTLDLLKAEQMGLFGRKGGEGSRGGHVVGHTPAGNPKYASNYGKHPLTGQAGPPRSMGPGWEPIPDSKNGGWRRKGEKIGRGPSGPIHHYDHWFPGGQEKQPELFKAEQLGLFGPRQPTVNPANKAPAGFTPIPGSKHGGYHKKEGSRYVYWYPGIGVVSAPHAGEPVAIHEQHAASVGAPAGTRPMDAPGQWKPPAKPEGTLAGRDMHGNRIYEGGEKKITIVRVNLETGKEEEVRPKPQTKPEAPKPAPKPDSKPKQPAASKKETTAPKAEPKLTLKPKEDTGKYETTGYVFGSRAELWSLRNSGELEKDPTLAYKLVTKDAVLGGKVELESFAAEREAGTEPAVAYLKYRLMQSIQSRPEDSPESRERFTSMIGAVQKSLASIRTMDEMKSFMQDINDQLEGVAPKETLSWEDIKSRGWEGLFEPMPKPARMGEPLTDKEQEEHRVAMNEWRNRRAEANTKILNYYDGRCDIRKVGDQWVAMSAVGQAIHADNIKNLQALGPRFLAIHGRKFVVGGSGATYVRHADSDLRKNVFSEVRKIQQLQEITVHGERMDPKADMAWAWMKGSARSKAAAGDQSVKRTEGGEKDRYHTILAQARLGAAVRRGPPIPGNASIGSADLKKSLGLNEVEYGHWVSGKGADEEAGRERQWHTEAAHAALVDLAALIGIPPEQIGQNGRLTMAFGSRGSGAARAHYSPQVKAINITKVFGQGALAHEYGHFLDHMMLHVAAPEKGRDPFASGGMKGGMKGEVSSELSPPVAKAVHKVMDAIKNKPGDPRQARINAHRLIEEKRRAYHEELWHGDKQKAEQMRLEVNAIIKDMNRASRSSSGYKEPTDFYAGAMKMGDYWSRPTEMFARCFESWVSDRLEAKGQVNTYLVQGAKPMEDVPGFYPGGEHRQRINSAMDELVEALRNDGHFKKSMRILTLSGR